VFGGFSILDRLQRRNSSVATNNPDESRRSRDGPSLASADRTPGALMEGEAMSSLGTRRTSIRGRAGVALMTAMLLLQLAPGALLPVLAASPLTITNVDSPDPVTSGGQLLYTITVTNTGGAKVTNAILTDQYNGLVGFGNPPLLDAVSSRGSCTQTNTQVTCNGGTIEGGGVWTVTIRGVVTAPAGTTINNNATVTATKSATTFTESASATTQVTGSGPGGPSPDLTIGKNGPLSAAAGGDITYTLTINNIGTANATGVKVTDTVPAGIGGISATGTSLFTCAVVLQNVTCTGGQVNAGSNATITITGTVAGAGPFLNTSVVDPDNTIDEGILGNAADAAELNNISNTVTTLVTPLPPPPTCPIKIDKTQNPSTVGSPPGVAVPGEVISYTIVVTNCDLGRADYLTMTDTTQGLQAANIQVLSAVATSGTNPVCTVNAPTVTCTMTRLAINGTMTVVIQGLVVASAGSTIINNATVNANIKNAGYSATDQVQTTIRPAIDLTVTQARTSPAPPAPVRAAAQFQYTITVGNSGLFAATDVVVREPLPAGVVFDGYSATGGFICAVDGANVVTCTGGTIGTNSSETITLHLLAPQAIGPITSTVTVDPGNAIGESDETNNFATTTTNVLTGIDLVVSKVANFDPIARNGTLRYTITVRNIGTQDTSGVVVRDTLPAGAEFRTASDTSGHNFTCSYANSIVNCVGGILRGTYSGSLALPIDEATLVIDVFAPDRPGTAHNEVRVDPDGLIPEILESNNLFTLDVQVENGTPNGAYIDLTVSLAPLANPIEPGALVVYTLTVSNSGSATAFNVTVWNFYPAGSTFLSAADTSPGANAFLCTHASGVVVCDGGSIPSGTSRQIQIRTLAPTALPQIPADNIQLHITDQALVDPTNAILEANESNNTSSTSSDVVPRINLTVVKDGPTEVSQGDSAKFTIKVTNEKPAEWTTGTTATGVHVQDALPVGLIPLNVTASSSPPTNFVCQVLQNPVNVVDCVGDIPTGKTVTITIETFVTAQDDTSFYNQAIVDPANTVVERNEADNTSTVLTAVGKPDLTVSKSAASDPIAGGENQVYTITVQNIGTASASGFLVRDPLPDGLDFVSANGSGFTCAENPVGSGIVECTYAGALAAGGSATITLTALVTTDAAGSLANTVTVDPDNAITEANEGNNVATVGTALGVDLILLSITDTPDPVNQGNILTYTTLITNAGALDAPSVEITFEDITPLGVDFVFGAGSEGFTCVHSGTDVTCAGDLDAGHSTTVTIKVLPTATSPSSMTVVATVDPDDDIVEVSNANNTQTAITTILPPDCENCIDLVMSDILVEPGTATRGETVTYTITAANAGDLPASDVLTAILLDRKNVDETIASITFSPVADTTFACSQPSVLTGERIQVECTGDLQAGEGVVITIVVNVLNTAVAPLRSEAEVDANHTIDEFLESNNEKFLNIGINP
jgi:uncharacterized repeat protein (TIGR01451 family)